MNRLIPAALVLLAVGCAGQPPSTPSSPPTSSVPQYEANPTLLANLPKSFNGELVSAEVRPVKVREAGGDKAKDGPESFVIRVRFTNGDDTLDTSGWSVFATAKDDIGNSLAEVASPATPGGFAEQNETHDIPPGKAAVRTFVFQKPIPKATSVSLSVGVNFPRRPSSFPFGPTLKIPLPPAK